MARILFILALMILLPFSASAVPYYSYPTASSLSGSEVMGPIHQGGNDVTATINQIFQNRTIPGAVISGATVDGRTTASRETDVIWAADPQWGGGVKCDGSTNDSSALQAALTAAANLGGRVVKLPATGHSCYLATGVTISDASHSGVTLEGTAASLYWPGPYDNTEGDWTQFGSWIKCGDTQNACVTIGGNSSGIRHINFWYSQPTPPANKGCGQFCTMTHNWTPTTYPFTILVNGTQNFNLITDIDIVNGYNCIDFEGGTNGVNTIHTYMDHVWASCFNTSVKFNRIDNVINVNDFHDNLWWFPFSSDVIGYTEGDTSSAGHKIGWDMYYLANLQGTGIEFYQDAIAMRATDQTVSSGLGNVTFGAQAVQLANVQFNQVCEAIGLAANTTHFNMRMSNVMLNVDPQTSNSTQCAGVTPSAFNLASSNADLGMTNLQVLFAQTIASVGQGGANPTSGGVLHINGLSAQNYSAYANGGAALVAQGGNIDVPNGLNWLFSQNSNAGPHFSGTPGSVTSAGYDTEGPAGTPRQFRWLTSPMNGSNFNSTRWGARVDSSSESGSNAGSNWNLDRYGDNGAYVDSPIEVTRSNGQVYMPDGLKVSLPTSCSGQTTGTFFNNSGAVNICP